MSEQDYDGLSDEIRARLLVSVSKEDADFIGMVVRQRNEAQAENERLRGALTYAVAFMRDQGYDFCPPDEFDEDALDERSLHVFARSALTKKEEG